MVGQKNLLGRCIKTIGNFNTICNNAYVYQKCVIFKILRENLFGGQRELLIASNIAKELKVESVGGHLYWSTGFSVKVAKLNGKEHQIYYSTDYFSGKKG